MSRVVNLTGKPMFSPPPIIRRTGMISTGVRTPASVENVTRKRSPPPIIRRTGIISTGHTNNVTRKRSPSVEVTRKRSPSIEDTRKSPSTRVIPNPTISPGSPQTMPASAADFIASFDEQVKTVVHHEPLEMRGPQKSTKKMLDVFYFLIDQLILCMYFITKKGKIVDIRGLLYVFLKIMLLFKSCFVGFLRLPLHMKAIVFCGISVLYNTVPLFGQLMDVVFYVLNTMLSMMNAPLIFTSAFWYRRLTQVTDMAIELVLKKVGSEASIAMFHKLLSSANARQIFTNILKSQQPLIKDILTAATKDTIMDATGQITNAVADATGQITNAVADSTLQLTEQLAITTGNMYDNMQLITQSSEAIGAAQEITNRMLMDQRNIDLTRNVVNAANGVVGLLANALLPARGNRLMNGGRKTAKKNREKTTV